MIRHPDRVGKAIVALTLVTDHTYRTTVNGGSSIKVSLGPSAVEEFQTEEEFMVWVLNMIKSSAERELEWFKNHNPSDYELGLAKAARK